MPRLTMEEMFHHEVSMSLHSPTEHENGLYSQNMLPASIRHSRARGNPGFFCAQLAWIPAFAGMTEPRRPLHCGRPSPYIYFRRRARRTRRFRKYLSELRALLLTIHENLRGLGKFLHAPEPRGRVSNPSLRIPFCALCVTIALSTVEGCGHSFFGCGSAALASSR